VPSTHVLLVQLFSVGTNDRNGITISGEEVARVHGARIEVVAGHVRVKTTGDVIAEIERTIISVVAFSLGDIHERANSVNARVVRTNVRIETNHRRKSASYTGSTNI